MAARDKRLLLLSPAGNMGPAAARNRCIEAARGRWIAVLDSDDLMHPDRLARLVAAAERDNADIVADDLLIFDDNNETPPSRCLRGADATAAIDNASAAQAARIDLMNSPRINRMNRA